MPEVAIAEELLVTAVEIEKKGYLFYSNAATFVRNREGKEQFEYLARQEKAHEGTFHAMLNRIGKMPALDVIQTGSKSYEYIKDVASAGIYSGEKAEKVLNQGNMSDIEAIETGIGFEIDSILFYDDLRGMLPIDEKVLVDAIIGEEKKHLSELTFLKNKLLLR